MEDKLNKYKFENEKLLKERNAINEELNKNILLINELYSNDDQLNDIIQKISFVNYFIENIQSKIHQFIKNKPNLFNKMNQNLNDSIENFISIIDYQQKEFDDYVEKYQYDIQQLHKYIIHHFFYLFQFFYLFTTVPLINIAKILIMNIILN